MICGLNGAFPDEFLNKMVMDVDILEWRIGAEALVSLMAAWLFLESGVGSLCIIPNAESSSRMQRMAFDACPAAMYSASHVMVHIVLIIFDCHAIGDLEEYMTAS